MRADASKPSWGHVKGWKRVRKGSEFLPVGLGSLKAALTVRDGSSDPISETLTRPYERMAALAAGLDGTAP
jgi:hypothetical protein